MSSYSDIGKDIVKTGVRKIRYLKGRTESAFLSDEKAWYCPCCESKVRKFKAGSFLKHPEIYDRRRFENTDQEVLCPVCLSFPRHRIMCHWIDKNMGMLQGRKILYFAPNPSVKAFLKRRGFAVTTADKFAKADLALDIMHIDLPDESQEMIICNHVMEYVEDYRIGLSELRRILKKDGVMIISFPIDESLETVYEDPSVTTPDERRRAYGESENRRLFGRDSAELLEKAGFEVSRIDGGDCPNKIKPAVGPAGYDVGYLFLCWKNSLAENICNDDNYNEGNK